jgi:hypothetical protein
MITGARLEIIDGAGHMVMIEKSQEFNSRVMDFLETLGYAQVINPAEVPNRGGEIGFVRLGGKPS